MNMPMKSLERDHRISRNLREYDIKEGKPTRESGLSLVNLTKSFQILQEGYDDLIEDEGEFYRGLKGGELFTMEREYEYWVEKQGSSLVEVYPTGWGYHRTHELKTIKEGTIMMYTSKRPVNLEDSPKYLDFIPTWLVGEKVVEISPAVYTLRRISIL